jgi:cytochrome c-type biogenesis protein CcmH/NrfG
MIQFLQTTGRTVEMADALRADGKFWVVVGVIALVFVCLASYLLWMDRKVTNLEKNKK